MRIIFVRLICVICCRHHRSTAHQSATVQQCSSAAVRQCGSAAAGQIPMRNEKATYVSKRGTKRGVASERGENECESHKLHAARIMKLGQPCATQPQCQLIISNKRLATIGVCVCVNEGESLKGHSRRRRIATFIKNSALSHGPPTRH